VSCAEALTDIVSAANISVMNREFIRSVVRRAGGPVKLSKLLGVSSSAVSQWKSIPAWHLTKVAEAASVPIDDLLPPQKSKPQSEEAA
jgi:DNA-binding transcriptional regulator YdaS (Cro superfamily)